MRRTVFFGLRRTSAALAFAVLATPAVSGCGGGSDALKKQVTSLETQLTTVRADQDRLEERMAALELSAPVPSRAAKGTTPAPVEHPRLKVIHLSPDQAGPAADPGGPPSTDGADSTGRRPAIRGTGDKVIKTGDADDASTQISPHNGEAKRPVAQLGSDPRGN
jgi:outer membrane murein-binding lipoprotein Lpp